MSQGTLPCSPDQIVRQNHTKRFVADRVPAAQNRMTQAQRLVLRDVRTAHASRQRTLHEIQPSFSPDGKLVLYVADNGFEHRLYVRRFDGTGDRLLLVSGGGAAPVW